MEDCGGNFNWVEGTHGRRVQTGTPELLPVWDCVPNNSEGVGPRRGGSQERPSSYSEADELVWIYLVASVLAPEAILVSVLCSRQ